MDRSGNKDTIAAELETLHFRRLLEEIIKLEEQSINTVRSEFKSKFKLDILGAQDTKETLTIQAAKIKKTLDDRVKDLKNLSASALNIASSLGFTNLEDALMKFCNQTPIFSPRQGAIALS